MKPIVCFLYPMHISAGGHKVKFCLDEIDCPKAKEFPSKFIKSTEIIFQKIKSQIPKYWLDFAAKFDMLFNYEKLECLKNKKTITTRELKDCIE